jgi:hypothetical protein
VGRQRRSAAVTSRESRTVARIDDLAPGAYAIDVTGLGAGSPVSPVSGTTLVWG